MSDVKFTKRSYYNVAQEHLVLAIDLHRSQQYFASHYFAGVAIESILRAYCIEGGDSFDRSHSLDYWASKEKLLPNGEEKQMAFRALLVEANLERQNLIFDTLRNALNGEAQHVGMVFTYTPKEYEQLG